MAKLDLDGKTFTFATVNDVLQPILVGGRPFPDDISRGGDKLVRLGFDLTGDKTFPIGQQSKFAIDYSATSQVFLDIIWFDNDDMSLLDAYGLKNDDPETIYLVFNGGGSLSVGAAAEAKAPAGIAASFGVKSGATADYLLFKPYPRAQPARDILSDFLRHLRLPHQIDKVDALPVTGELIVLKYGGFLEVGGSFAWGASLSKSKGFGLGQVDLTSTLNIEAQAKLALGYKVAGNFSVEVRAGTEPQWARVVVRKDKRDAFDFAADVSVGIDLQTTGWPADADQFLEALIGFRTPEIVKDVRDSILDGGLDEFLDFLKNKADGAIQTVIEQLFERWWPEEEIAKLYGEAEELQAKVHARLQGVIRKYEEISNLDQKLIDFLESYRGDEKKLREIIDKVVQLPDRTKLIAITDSKVWNFLEAYAGDKLFELATDDEAFNAFKTKLQNIKQKGLDEVHEFIEARKKALNIDDALNVLKQIETPQKLRDTAEKIVLELARRLTGAAFDQIGSIDELQKAFDRLQGVLRKIDTFKSNLYDKLQNSLNHSTQLAIGVAYSRAKENDALIDVEVNLAASNGSKLMKRAVRGDFTELITLSKPDTVRVRSTVFRRQESQSTRLKVNLFGWSYESLHEMVIASEETIQESGDGLLHIYSTKATERVARIKRDEETHMAFVYELLARGLQVSRQSDPALIDTISRMAISYRYEIKDTVVSDDEMLDYLTLAAYLGLLKDDLQGSEGEVARQFMQAFKQDLGGDWGSVSVNYEVHYNTETLLGVFELPENTIRAVVSRSFSKILATNFRSYYQAHAEADALAIAKLAPATNLLAWDQSLFFPHVPSARAYKAKSLVDGKEIRVTLSRAGRLELMMLRGALQQYMKAILALDAEMDRARRGNEAPNRDRLREAFTDFIKMRDDLEQIALLERDRLINPFFAILDNLIATRGAKARSSLLKIKFQRKGSEPVTKILTA